MLDCLHENPIKHWKVFYRKLSTSGSALALHFHVLVVILLFNHSVIILRSFQRCSQRYLPWKFRHFLGKHQCWRSFFEKVAVYSWETVRKRHFNQRLLRKENGEQLCFCWGSVSNMHDCLSLAHSSVEITTKLSACLSLERSNNYKFITVS